MYEEARSDSNYYGGSTSSYHSSDPYGVEDYDDPGDFADEWTEEFGDGSCATASGWLAIPRPNANVSPITRIFRSLKPALEIIFIPLIRIIPKTVMIAPPSTAFGIAEKIAPSFGKNPEIIRINAPVAIHHLFTTFVMATIPAF